MARVPDVFAFDIVAHGSALDCGTSALASFWRFHKSGCHSNLLLRLSRTAGERIVTPWITIWTCQITPTSGFSDAVGSSGIRFRVLITAFEVVSRGFAPAFGPLRPSTGVDGHYGIPHETRLMFRLMHELDDISVTGLINHPSQILARTFRKEAIDRVKSTPRDVRAYSRLAASICPPFGTLERLQHRSATALKLAWLQVLAKLGVPISLDHFDGTKFADFLWQGLFALSLPPTNLELCRTASYASLWAPWRALHSTAFTPWPWPYARIDTRGYDVFIAQTPWPGSTGESRRSPGLLEVAVDHFGDQLVK